MPSVVYFVDTDGKGDWYRCISAASAGESPATHPAKWDKIDIPSAFKRYLVSRMTSICQKGDGQNDKARAELGESAALIDDAIMRELKTRGRMRRSQVFSR